jgi:hypothetical protein
MLVAMSLEIAGTPLPPELQTKAPWKKVTRSSRDLPKK